MKRLLALAAVTLSAVSFAAPAIAAEPAYNWSGFYAGANLGGAWADFEKDAGTVGPGGSDGGITGGVQGGYNWQRDNFVLGGEVEFSGLDLGVSDAVHSYSEDWMMTFRGRAGYAIGQFLPYVTVGLGVTETEAKLNSGGSEGDEHYGLAAGAGVDYHWFDHWSSRVEYLYVGAPTESDRIGATNVSGGSDNNIIRIGVNYSFN